MVTPETFLDEESFEDLSDYTPGEIVAERYELVRPLGTGGMGVVWRAEDLILGRTVALKLVRADRAHPLLGKRLLTEARAAAAVEHPCVVDILDLGTTNDDDTYLVMELLDGAELDERLDHGPMRPVAAVSIVAALADALRAAHAAGVVHRDIKATNVFMARSMEDRTRPVLIDFGIARLVDASEDVRLTVTGSLLGTPTYMSPEQAGGSRNVDRRTDIWSLSVLLYELVTGGPPFAGENYNEVLKRMLMDAPPSFGSLEDDDEELWAIVERGLRKDVEERWPSAEALLGALDRWLVGRGQKHDITGRALSPAPKTTTTSGSAPSARQPRVDSIEPTVLGVPRKASSVAVDRSGSELTWRVVPVGLGLAAAAAALIAAFTTSSAPPPSASPAAAGWSTRLAVPRTPPEVAAPQAAPRPPDLHAPQPASNDDAATTPSDPAQRHDEPESKGVRKAARDQPRQQPGQTPKARTTTSMGLPLPSHPNF